MIEEKEIISQEESEQEIVTQEVAEVENAELVVEDTETPLDKNVRLMSPTRMVLRRFFRSKLSLIGLIMLISLFVFCWLGPVFYTKWGEIQTDRTGNIDYIASVVMGADGKQMIQMIRRSLHHFCL